MGRSALSRRCLTDVLWYFLFNNVARFVVLPITLRINWVNFFAAGFILLVMILGIHAGIVLNHLAIILDSETRLVVLDVTQGIGLVDLAIILDSETRLVVLDVTQGIGLVDLAILH